MTMTFPARGRWTRGAHYTGAEEYDVGGLLLRPAGSSGIGSHVEEAFMDRIVRKLVASFQWLFSDLVMRRHLSAGLFPVT
jgi:hypothetical protein